MPDPYIKLDIDHGESLESADIGITTPEELGTRLVTERTKKNGKWN